MRNVWNINRSKFWNSLFQHHWAQHSGPFLMSIILKSQNQSQIYPNSTDYFFVLTLWDLVEVWTILSIPNSFKCLKKSENSRIANFRKTLKLYRWKIVEVPKVPRCFRIYWPLEKPDRPIITVFLTSNWPFIIDHNSSFASTEMTTLTLVIWCKIPTGNFDQN